MNTNEARNILRAALLLAITILPLKATVLTANFDAMSGTPRLYQEGGISFDNGGDAFAVAHAAYQWFWNMEPAAIVGRTVTISTGALMTGVSLFVGNNWSDYLIAYGQLHPVFAWETWLGNNLTGQGSINGVGKGVAYDITDHPGFDRLTVSTWSEFGQGSLALGWITVETVNASKAFKFASLSVSDVESVSDAGSTMALLLIALMAMSAFRSRSWSPVRSTGFLPN